MALRELPPRYRNGTLAIGILATIIAIALLWGSWAEVLIVLAATVVLPIALPLLFSPGKPEPLKIAQWLQLPAALLLIPAFLLPAGLPAGALVLPWLLLTILIGLTGACRFVCCHSFSYSAASLQAGMAFLPIGSAWLLLSRLGAEPLDFQEPIILLTAAHFHYAGLALPVLSGLAARHLRSRLSNITTMLVITGVPLVAIGITVKHLLPHLAWIEAIAAWYLSLACVLVAILQFQIAGAARPQQRALLTISSLSLLLGMALASIYALGMLLQTKWLSIPVMLVTHAILNAIGFVLLGLIAWRLKKARSAL